jgi:DNA-binding response OmpR family regulator
VRPQVRVLIIDDNPVQLSTREAVLRDAGFQVSIATTAPSALALLQASSTPFHAIVTDHVMPKVSGADFVRSLRKVNPHIPVLVVSGMPDIESDYQGLDVLVRHKPLPPQELIELLKAVTHSNGATAQAS